MTKNGDSSITSMSIVILGTFSNFVSKNQEFFNMSICFINFVFSESGKSALDRSMDCSRICSSV